MVALGALSKEARFALPTKAIALGQNHFVGAGHAKAHLAHWWGFKGVHLLDGIPLDWGPIELAPCPGDIGVIRRVVNEVWMPYRNDRDRFGVTPDHGLWPFNVFMRACDVVK